MQIQIKNIWTVKEATINLDWLSVIAWGNDTWKSTVSKVIFSVIKAFQKYNEFSWISKENIIKKKIDDLYIDLRSIFQITNKEINDNHKKLNFDDVKSEFEPINFIKWLEEDLSNQYFIEKEKIINKLKISSGFNLLLLENLENIKKEYFKKETREYLIEKALNNIFESEFKLWLNCEDKEWKITAKDWESPLFEIRIKNNKVSKIIIDDDVMKIKDSTFSDTPIILNFFNDFYSSNKLQYHIQDLFRKIVDISNNNNERVNWLWKKIRKIVKGEFVLRKKIAWYDLSFKKEWVERNIETINTATWIKSFWLLDLLDQSGILNKESLIIIDEPEVHLHPEWQVLYAELIVNLIEDRDLSVLITSHSPYIIEALSKFSKNREKVKASFYLAEKNEKWVCNINDKTNEKYEIFQKLSKPFRDLMLK